MSTEVEIRAPAEQTEGTRSQILRWLKSVGESVTENEPLIELETDKVTVEVPSPGSGTLREILKQEQDEIGPGELLGRIEAAGVGRSASTGTRASDDAQASSSNMSASADAVRAAADAAMQGSADAVVSVPISTPSDADGGRAGQGGRAGSSDAYASGTVLGSHVGSNDASNGRVAHQRTAGVEAPGLAAQTLSPAVKRLLAERGLDPSAVRGTGQGGRITVADILAHGHPGGAQSASTSAAVGSAASATQLARGAPSTGSPLGGRASSGASSPNEGAAIVGGGAGTRRDAGGAPFSGGGAGTSRAAQTAADGATDAAGPRHRVPHTATRKRIAEHMVQSLLHTAPHVTTVFEADLTAVLEHRQRNKDDFMRRGAPLTLTAYFLQATVVAIRAVPEANSRWTDSALEVFDSMHIGLATALETGLVVPVLRDVQSRDLFETAKGLDDLVSRARDGRLTPADMRGGTFTISNHGVSGSLVATPIIINQPQSAILGVGKLEKRPVVITSEDTGEDRIVIRPRCYVTLTIDHRVMDGHQANRFLQTFVEWLAKPR
jgi:2-oxoglutarate dehydrogenase E2 component (dihydrolipoamide succinyltransferase)